VKRIAVLTRDCAGVNAAIRAVVRTAAGRGVEVRGVLKGFEGLIDGLTVPLTRRSVSGIINLGGTILKSARCERFLSADWRGRAAETVRRLGIDGLIVMGGNGSLHGAHLLHVEAGVPVVGIPATIDNDINGVDLALGADTAVNVALDALDKIRDTATSLERIFVVEVMGRDCGYIALQVALAGGCEEVLIPERDYDPDRICADIKAGNAEGKVSWIIIVAEGKARAEDVARAITDRTGFETRVAVLGHIQRGGRPTALDRIMAARLGRAAVDALLEGCTDCCVRLRNGVLDLWPLDKAVLLKTTPVESDYRLLKLLS
jgi:6-phosphofructokinase 1